MKKLTIILFLVLFSLLPACGGGGGGGGEPSIQEPVPLPQDRLHLNLTMAFAERPGEIVGFVVVVGLPAGVEPHLEGATPTVTFSEGVPNTTLRVVNYAPPSEAAPGKLTLSLPTSEPFRTGPVGAALLSIPLGRNLPAPEEFEILESSIFEKSASLVVPVPDAPLTLSVAPY